VRASIAPWIDERVDEVGYDVQHGRDQRIDIYGREYDGIIAVDQGFEAEKPEPVEREDLLDQKAAREEGRDERTGKSSNDNEHGVTKNVAVEHARFGNALGASRGDVLLSNLVEERVLGQECHGRERTDGHGNERQRQMPEVIFDLREKRELRPVVRREPFAGEPLKERAAREHDDEKNRKEKAGNGISDDECSRRPDIEPASILDGLANAERYRDEIGREHHP
jgi:hypothetical protein